jgi:hypothetical protein
MRLPKLRGFKNPARIEYQVVNVSTINSPRAQFAIACQLRF